MHIHKSQKLIKDYSSWSLTKTEFRSILLEKLHCIMDVSPILLINLRNYKEIFKEIVRETHKNVCDVANYILLNSSIKKNTLKPVSYFPI